MRGIEKPNFIYIHVYAFIRKSLFCSVLSLDLKQNITLLDGQFTLPFFMEMTSTIHLLTKTASLFK